MYVARARPCTQSVHGRVQTVYTAVNTAVYRVHDRVGVPCTRPWTHYVHSRVHGHGRPCTWPVHGRLHSLYTSVGSRIQTVHGRPRVHGRTRATHMVRPCPEHGRLRSRYVAKHTRPGTRPVPDRVRTVYMAVHGPCTVYTAVFTAHVHGRVRTMYTAVHGPSMT